MAWESQKPSASRYETLTPKSWVFRKSPVLRRAYTDVHTRHEYSPHTVRHDGGGDGSIATVPIPSSFRPSWGNPRMAIY